MQNAFKVKCGKLESVVLADTRDDARRIFAATLPAGRQGTITATRLGTAAEWLETKRESV